MISLKGVALGDTNINTKVITQAEFNDFFEGSVLNIKNSTSGLTLKDTNVNQGKFRDGLFVKEKNIAVFVSKNPLNEDSEVDSVYYTNDGINFASAILVNDDNSETTFPKNAEYETPCYGGGLFLLTSSKGMYISEDGKKWKSGNVTLDNVFRRFKTTSDRTWSELQESDLTKQEYGEPKYFHDTKNDRHIFIIGDALGLVKTNTESGEKYIKWSHKPCGGIDCGGIIRNKEEDKLIFLDRWHYSYVDEYFQENQENVQLSSVTACSFKKTPPSGCNLTYTQDTIDYVEQTESNDKKSNVDTTCEGVVMINGEPTDIILIPPTDNKFVYYTFNGINLYPLVTNRGTDNQSTLLNYDDTVCVNYETPFIDMNGRIFISSCRSINDTQGTYAKGIFYIDDIFSGVTNSSTLDSSSDWSSLPHGWHTVVYNTHTNLYYTNSYKQESPILISPDGTNWTSTDFSGNFYPITDIDKGFVVEDHTNGGLKYVGYYSEIVSKDYLLKVLNDLVKQINAIHTNIDTSTGNTVENLK